jgi:hypothetical protein
VINECLLVINKVVVLQHMTWLAASLVMLPHWRTKSHFTYGHRWTFDKFLWHGLYSTQILWVLLHVFLQLILRASLHKSRIELLHISFHSFDILCLNFIHGTFFMLIWSCVSFIYLNLFQGSKWTCVYIVQVLWQIMMQFYMLYLRYISEFTLLNVF